MAKTNFEKLMKDKNFLASVLTDDCGNCPARSYCDRLEDKDKTCMVIKREWLDAKDPSKEDILRKNILHDMNKYILKCIGDEDIHMTWLTGGIPDGADEDEIMEIAEDKAEFERIAYLFGNLVCDFK